MLFYDDFARRFLLKHKGTTDPMDNPKPLSPSSNEHEEQEIALFRGNETKKFSDEEGLPPMDGGFHAWMFLAASTMIEALTWGSSGSPPLLFTRLRLRMVGLTESRICFCFWGLSKLLS